MIQTATRSDGARVAERARQGDLAGEALAQALGSAGDLTALDLSGARLDATDLRGLSLFKANLRGASLRNADLSGVELTGADLTEADLEGACLRGAGLGMACLRDVRGFRADFREATLTGASLEGAMLNCADLSRARAREANLIGVDLRAADLRGTELSLCRVRGAVFDDADMRGARLRAVQEFARASWYGVDIRDINFAGAYRLHRHVVDENYLREFREAGRIERVLYGLWWLTSDCGRSLGRWVVNIALVAAAFALMFSVVGVETGNHTPNLMTYLYYSVVTLTSLGYGDIVPSSSTGQMVVMLEVFVGYMMLGGLISILANKMARRGE
jgi:uncharacterized protein YjbI with pentapeptide repeats